MCKSVFIFLVLAACGDDGNSHPDGQQGGETGGHSIKISGVATQQAVTGGTPAQGVVVAAFKNSDEQTAVTMATSDAQGAYSLTVMTDGSPLDGFLKATKSGNVDTYLYPPAPLAMDFMDASVNELDTGLFDTLANNTTLGCGNTGTQTMIILEVFDAAMMPVAGVAVTSTPAAGKVGYTTSQSNPLPNFAGTGTLADGRAYLCQLPEGAVMVTGTETGATFKTTSLKTHAGALTTTVVTE